MSENNVMSAAELTRFLRGKREIMFVEMAVAIMDVFRDDMREVDPTAYESMLEGLGGHVGLYAEVIDAARITVKDELEAGQDGLLYELSEVVGGYLARCLKQREQVDAGEYRLLVSQCIDKYREVQS